VDQSTPLTHANIEAMAKVLTKNRKQLVGGFALLKKRSKPVSVR
jgi:hypothetical protein